MHIASAVEVTQHQSPKQGARAELSREMGWHGSDAAPLPSQPSFEAMHPPFGFIFLVNCWGEKSSRSQVRRAFLCRCYSLLPVSNGKPELGEGPGAWTALPMSPQEPATSSMFPLTTTPAPFTPALLSFLHSPAPWLLIAKSFCTGFQFLVTVLCITPWHQYPPFPCLFCVQLVIQGSSWVNCTWQVWSTFPHDQSSRMYHSTLYDAALFQHRKNVYRISIKG